MDSAGRYALFVRASVGHVSPLHGVSHGVHPPNPPFARGGKLSDEFGGTARPGTQAQALANGTDARRAGLCPTPKNLNVNMRTPRVA